MKGKKVFKNLISLSFKYKQLYLSFILSFACIFVSIACLIGFTYAWFSTSETTDSNSIEAGMIAIELFNSNDTYGERIEINQDNPLFTSEDTLELGGEIYKELVVSNHGTLPAEYNIGIKVETVNTGPSEGEIGDISELIDVFLAKVDESTKSVGKYINPNPGPHDETEIEKYLYLGTLSYMNSNTNYESDNRIVVKGLLDPQYKSVGVESDDYEDFYSLRFKMKDKAEAKYQNCNIRISMELVSNKKVDDICTITALSNNEEYGLVLGGGTYYIDDEHEINLIPQPKEGYKFQKWAEDSLTDDPRIIVTNSDKVFTAIFVKATEFEEDIDDPWADEPEDIEDFNEGDDDPFED